MRRREFFQTSFLGASVALGFTRSAASMYWEGQSRGDVPTSRPNVILISFDDAGWHDVGYHGSDIKTPTIDRMARQGIELDQFYSSAVCTPTRAGLMTGRPPSRIGVTEAIGAEEKPPLPRTQITIGEVLRRAGYDTCITGKWHLGNTLDYGPATYGFNHSHGFLGPWVDYYTHRTQKGKRDWHRNGKYIDQEGHATDLIANEAIDFVSTYRNKSKPFFMYVSFNAPHLPLQEDEKWLAQYPASSKAESRRFYSALTTHADDSIRRILATLDTQRLAANTLVLLFSDNGGESGGRKGYLDPQPTLHTTSSTDLYGMNSPLRGWKGQLYEGGVRVPALVYWPGKLKPGRSAQPVAVYDVLPTVAALTSSAIPAGMTVEGIDVWRAIQGQESLSERIIYWRSGNQIAVRKGNWKLVHLGKVATEGKDEVYNIAEDPYEQHDLAQARADMAASLKAELLRQVSLD